MNPTDDNQDLTEDVIELNEEEEASDVDNVAAEALRAVEAVREAHRDDEHGLALVDDMEALHAELADVKERLARTQADFENYRKRSARERTELSRFAASESLREFLDVVDNLERALGAGGSVDDLKMGVEMIHRQMLDLLRRAGVEPVAAVGKVFDPAVHEAVSRQESPDCDEPRVQSELQKGYSLWGRLLRPARVTVLVPATSAGAEDPEADA